MICFSSTQARLETGFGVSVPTGLSKIRRHFHLPGSFQLLFRLFLKLQDSDGL